MTSKWIAAIALVTVPLALPPLAAADGDQAVVYRVDLCEELPRPINCITAIARSAKVCTPSVCEYSHTGGAKACALLGGQVNYFSSSIIGGFDVPINTCQEKTQGRVGEFSPCLVLTAELLSVSGTMTSKAVACAVE